MKNKIMYILLLIICIGIYKSSEECVKSNAMLQSSKNKFKITEKGKISDNDIFNFAHAELLLFPIK